MKIDLNPLILNSYERKPLLRLQQDVVYGPVSSRRLGASLGINPLLTDRKVCTFNCLYCQYGWTDASDIFQTTFPSVQNILSKLEDVLKILPAPPAYLTLSGNGEPTLHPAFPELVDGVISLRDQLCPSARTAVLSNASRVGVPAVRKALERLDLRIMKLDAGSQEVLDTYNQPRPSIRLDDITDGLASLGDVTIQTLLAGGPGGNAGEANLQLWIERIRLISPLQIQLYSLDRGCPSDAIVPVHRSDLADVALRLKEDNLNVDCFPSI